MTDLLAEFGTGQVFWSMLWFFMFFIWIWLLFTVFADIFRSDDLSGWGKAIWIIFVIFLPYLGVLVYFIARGNKMAEHAQRQAARQDAAFRQYVQQAAAAAPAPGAPGAPAAGSADELARLAQLRDQGVLTDAEFQQQKAKLLG